MLTSTLCIPPKSHELCLYSIVPLTLSLLHCTIKTKVCYLEFNSNIQVGHYTPTYFTGRFTYGIVNSFFLVGPFSFLVCAFNEMQSSGFLIELSDLLPLVFASIVWILLTTESELALQIHMHLVLLEEYDFTTLNS